MRLPAALLALLALPAAAQPENKIYLSWVPKPVKLPGYAGVNRPVTRLAEVIAGHKGQASWTQEVIQTDRYDARWIQMAPGEKTRTQFYGDDRTVWVVWGGKIRFTIKGQQPFVASKGLSGAGAAARALQLETVGDEPSLRFEITRGGHILPSYPVDSRDGFGAPPPPKDGQHYVKVSYPTSRWAAAWALMMKPTSPISIFSRTWLRNILRASSTCNSSAITTITRRSIADPGVPTPPDTNLGHFHIDNDEFWFILEGRCDYLIEKVGLHHRRCRRHRLRAAGALASRQLGARQIGRGPDGYAHGLPAQPDHATQLRAGRQRHAVALSCPYPENVGTRKSKPSRHRPARRRRQFALEPAIVQIDMHVGEDGALGLHPRDPFQRARQIGVAGMGRVAQRIHDPAFHAFQRREGSFVQRIDIAANKRAGRSGSPGERMRPWRCPKASTGTAPPAPAISNGAKGSGISWALRMGG